MKKILRNSIKHESIFTRSVQREQGPQIVASDIEDEETGVIVRKTSAGRIQWMIVPFPCWTITAAAGKQEIGWVVDPRRPVLLRFVMINVQRLVLDQAIRAEILKEVLKEPAPILLIGCPRRKRWRWT